MSKRWKLKSFLALSGIGAAVGFALQALPSRASQSLELSNLAEELGSPNDTRSLDALTGSTETMNQVTLLHLGRESKPARMKLLAEAERYLFMTVPYWFDDKEGRELLAAVTEKREAFKARGRDFDMRVLVDWTSPVSSGDFWGSKMYRKIGEALDGKVNQWNRLWNHRSWSSEVWRNRIHDKIMVADGEKLIIGGMNVADEYLEGGLTRKGWHDTDVLIEGPAAQQGARHFLAPYLLQRYLDRRSNPFPTDATFQHKVLQDVFYRNASHTWFKREWFWQPRQVPVELPFEQYVSNPHYFPPLADTPERDSPVRLIYGNPFVDYKPGTRKPVSRLMNTLEFLMPRVRRSMKLFVPYLTTTERMNELLIEAAGRGVDVRILTNSLKSHDLNYKAALKDFAKLLKAGVRIFEWQGHADLEAIEKAHGCRIENYWPGRTLHTKAIVLDDQVALLGSHNFNVRSELYNSEIMGLFRDPRVARQLSGIFDYDLDFADESAVDRSFQCGNKFLTHRPPRSKETTLAMLAPVFKKEGLWIEFLHLFQGVM